MANIQVITNPQTPNNPNRNVLIEMFAVQIINIRSDDPLSIGNPFFECYTHDMNNLPSLKESNSKWNQFPKWFKYFMDMEGAYKNSYCTKLDTSGDNSARSLAQTLQTRLQAVFEVENEITLDLDAFDAYLYYNFGLRQWILLYHAEMNSPQNDLQTLLRLTYETGSKTTALTAEEQAYLDDVNRPNILHDIDFYNVVRDMFAVSDNWDQIAPQVANLQTQARKNICELTHSLYNITLNAKDDIDFPDSSTNTTFFYTMPEGSTEAQMKEMREVLLKANCDAERKKDEPIDVAYGEVYLYLFWGRFNTIELKPPLADKRLAQQLEVTHQGVAQYMPINFHAQLLWGYAMHMSKAMQAIEESLLKAKTASNKMQMRYFGALINSIEYAHFENETFRRGIEHDNEQVYRVIEDRWSLERSITQLKDFATYLSNYIDREYQENLLRADRKQNVVLFIIALLGIFGLISIWDDYLDIVNEVAYQEMFEGTFLGVVFPTLDAFQVFSVGLPIFTMLICIIAAICMYIWRPK